MLHVTMDITETLRDLETRMSKLVRWRDETVRQAKRIIAQTNSEFDELAIPLGRDINELRERLQLEVSTNGSEPAKPARRRRRKPPALDGLDATEQAHYLELQARKRNK